MNEQIVELEVRNRKFIFKIPYSDYLPFKEAEREILQLIEEINPPEDKLDYGLVYSALKLAIENKKLKEINNSENIETDKRINALTEKLEIFLNQ